MKTSIADLIVEIPEAGDLIPRCRDYMHAEEESADIIIRTDLFKPEEKPGMDKNLYIYLKSGFYFYGQLLNFNGMMLHASAIELHGKAYLFSGDCGVGKSTHTRLWQSVFGECAHVFNDDKPALRYIDNVWYAYGTPWCGKNAININQKVQIAGICFLKQAEKNCIKRLSSKEAIQRILLQTPRRILNKDSMELLLSHVDKLVRNIPVFELENKPEIDAVYLSYETMSQAAEEVGL